MATTHLTGETLGETVKDNDIVLVDFWATWCPPCRMFGPIFEAASEKHEGIVFGKVDTDAEQGLATDLEITSIPTLMAFRDGILVYRQPGALRAADLDRLIDEVQALDMDAIRAQLAARQNADA